MSKHKYILGVLYVIALCKCDESQGKNFINEGKTVFFLHDRSMINANFHFPDMSFWLAHGQEHLVKVLAHKNIERKAKNVIIFLGDGMGLSTITTGRIFKGQSKGQSGEEYKLAFENFPNTGFSKVDN